MDERLKQTDELREEGLLQGGGYKKDLMESIIQLLRKSTIQELDLIYRIIRNMLC